MSLADKLSAYNQTGPPLLHTPQFSNLLQHICDQLNKNHYSRFPSPHLQVSLGGGIGEKTSSTLDTPDVDLNVWWEVSEEVLAVSYTHLTLPTKA